MDKKYNIAKTINILFSIGVVITIMLCAYNAWSLYGEYTTFSFFASLVMHGTFGVMIYCGIGYSAECLTKLNNDEKIDYVANVSHSIKLRD